MSAIIGYKELPKGRDKECVGKFKSFLNFKYDVQVTRNCLGVKNRKGLVGPDFNVQLGYDMTDANQKFVNWLLALKYIPNPSSIEEKEKLVMFYVAKTYSNRDAVDVQIHSYSPETEEEKEVIEEPMSGIKKFKLAGTGIDRDLSQGYVAPSTVKVNKETKDYGLESTPEPEKTEE